MAAVSVKRSIVQSNYFSAGDWAGGGTSYNGLYGEREGSVRDGYLFQASSMCKGGDFCS